MTDRTEARIVAPVEVLAKLRPRGLEFFAKLSINCEVGYFYYVNQKTQAIRRVKQDKTPWYIALERSEKIADFPCDPDDGFGYYIDNRSAELFRFKIPGQKR
jgi:hypothetical protein